MHTGRPANGHRPGHWILFAFLVNDAICLVFTPLVVEIVKSAELNPLPYLLGVAMASNVGSVATITGNPQNILIGSLSQISYVSFARALSLPALAGLVLTIAFITLGFRSEFPEAIAI